MSLSKLKQYLEREINQRKQLIDGLEILRTLESMEQNLAETQDQLEKEKNTLRGLQSESQKCSDMIKGAKDEAMKIVAIAKEDGNKVIDEAKKKADSIIQKAEADSHALTSGVASLTEKSNKLAIDVEEKQEKLKEIEASISVYKQSLEKLIKG